MGIGVAGQNNSNALKKDQFFTCVFMLTIYDGCH
jgi:hypothetical protein